MDGFTKPRRAPQRAPRLGMGVSHPRRGKPVKLHSHAVRGRWSAHPQREKPVKLHSRACGVPGFYNVAPGTGYPPESGKTARDCLRNTYRVPQKSLRPKQEGVSGYALDDKRKTTRVHARAIFLFCGHRQKKPPESLSDGLFFGHCAYRGFPGMLHFLMYLSTFDLSMNICSTMTSAGTDLPFMASTITSTEREP